MSLGDRIVVMRDGRIQQVGAPVDVYRAPANHFVATFIGIPAMNMAAGTLERRGDRVRFAHGDMSFECPASRAPRLNDGERAQAILGVRPEHLRLDATASPSLPARIDAVEPLGDRVDVIAATPLGRWTLRVDAAHAPREGSETTIALDAGAVHFFRADAEGDHW